MKDCKECKNQENEIENDEEKERDRIVIKKRYGKRKVVQSGNVQCDDGKEHVWPNNNEQVKQKR